MFRRQFCSAACIGAGFASAGCVDGIEGDGDTSGDGTTDRDTSSESDDAPETDDSKRTVTEATIFGKERYPVDLETGQRLLVEVSVARGGPMVVDVANFDEGESVYEAVVTTDERIELDVEVDGTHYVTFQGHDEAAVTITVVG